MKWQQPNEEQKYTFSCELAESKRWHFGNLLGICFWLGIFLNKPKKIPAPIRSFDDLFHENQNQFPNYSSL